MRSVFLNGPRDIQVAQCPVPRVVDPTDAIVKLSAASICGSDLWSFRGIDDVRGTRMGHEYAGVISEVGSGVTKLRRGDFVVGSFMSSDGTCELCRSGYPVHCVRREPAAFGAQAEFVRIPLADGTLVRTPTTPDPALIPSLLAASDVLGTAWFAADAAQVGPETSVAVVGDGAVGLLAVMSAKQRGATRILVMSRNPARQAMAMKFGATDIVEVRGDAAVAEVKRLTGGLGVHSTIEAVGTSESMLQAIRSTRPGGCIGYVGLPHDVSLPGREVFLSGVHLHGGPAPVRRYLPLLIDLIWTGEIDPGQVYDLTLPIEESAEGYAAMDERKAVKVMLTF
ncbi:Threonine dehydrogenase [Rathayibacter oskolensis]|uniref:Threonine dehydrogenase n=1 Tax=Rathayibacter oskolensis TaxID=1891671 RepID=A0A1X7P0C7_9MICO|nr:zinc-binding dehydrogenase [Rathayibacter oskolensis]SMH44080.1 Threonine dehydrogenase [Rathayibacter oskolensis]